MTRVRPFPMRWVWPYPLGENTQCRFAFVFLRFTRRLHNPTRGFIT